MLDNYMLIYLVIVMISIISALVYIFYLPSKIEMKQVAVSLITSLILVGGGYSCLTVADYFSVDSFNIVFDPAPYWNFMNGRYLNTGIILASLRLGLDQIFDQKIFLILWIVSTAITCSIVAKSLLQYLAFNYKTVIITTAAVAISFVNVFMMELLLFPEMAMVLMIGSLCLGLAIYFSLMNCHNKLVVWAISAFFLLAALGSYQSYIAIYITFVCAGFWLKGKNSIKQILVNVGLSLIIGGVASLINVLLLKTLVLKGILADSGRGATFSMHSIIENIKMILKYQIDFWENCDDLYRVALIMPIIGIGLLALSIGILRKLDDSKKKIMLCFTVLGSYILAFAPHIIEKEAILTPRSNIGIWATISLVIIFSQIYVRRLSNCLLVIIIASNIFYMQNMLTNTRVVNAIDFVEGEQISRSIMDYEKKSGKYITKVGIAYDKYPTLYHPISEYANAQLGARILATDYSGYRFIGYLLKRSLEKVNMPSEIYENYFANKDWPSLNINDQIYFEGDTMYWCVY